MAPVSRKERGARIWWLPAGAALAGAACSQLLGVSEYRVPRGPKAEAGAPDGRTGAPDARPVRPYIADDACRACVESKCAPELDACAGEAFCATWEGSVGLCAPGDGACEHACFVQSGFTDAKMGDISVCTQQNCTDECQTGGLFSTRSSACWAAVRQPCVSSFRDCVDDPDCRAATKCLFENNCALPMQLAGSDAAITSAGKMSPPCVWACLDKSHSAEPQDAGAQMGAAASALYRQVICAWSTAPDDCFGDLSCAGSYHWPISSSPKTSFEVFVHMGGPPEIPGTPVPGLPVRLCGSQSPDCFPVVASVTTGADGRAPVTFGPGSGPFYFQLEPGWPDGPRYLLFESSRPLYEGTTVSLPIGDANFQKLTDPGNDLTRGTWNRERGGLIVELRDCNATPVRGAEIHLDDETGVARRWAALSGVFDQPNAGAYVDDFFGVQPGLRTVTAWKDGRKVAEETVVVKPDGITFMFWMQPLAAP